MEKISRETFAHGFTWIAAFTRHLPNGLDLDEADHKVAFDAYSNHEAPEAAADRIAAMHGYEGHEGRSKKPGEPVSEDEMKAGEMAECENCGSKRSLAEIYELFPGAISCCPDRSMRAI